MERGQGRDGQTGSAFRPLLKGCVANDRRMAETLSTFYCEALQGIVLGVRRSLECRGQDRRAEALFYEMAEEEMREFRTLGELILALGGRLEPCVPARASRRRMTMGNVQMLLEDAGKGERMRMRGYEELLRHTGDRVVRSVLSGLLARHRQMLERLEHFGEE